VLVPDIAGLEGIGLRLHFEDQVDDVLERQVVRVRPVPAAPAQVVATPDGAIGAETGPGRNLFISYEAVYPVGATLILPQQHDCGRWQNGQS